MRAWLLTVGEPLPGEKGRMLRAGVLASKLAARGHDVTWWTTRFDHFHKRQRIGPAISHSKEGYKIRLLESRGYHRNRSLARLWDHVQVARAFRRAGLTERRPDIIVASF